MPGPAIRVCGSASTQDVTMVNPKLTQQEHVQSKVDTAGQPNMLCQLLMNLLCQLYIGPVHSAFQVLASDFCCVPRSLESSKGLRFGVQSRGCARLELLLVVRVESAVTQHD